MFGKSTKFFYYGFRDTTSSTWPTPLSLAVAPAILPRIQRLRGAILTRKKMIGNSVRSLEAPKLGENPRKIDRTHSDSENDRKIKKARGEEGGAKRRRNEK